MLFDFMIMILMIKLTWLMKSIWINIQNVYFFTQLEVWVTQGSFPEKVVINFFFESCQIWVFLKLLNGTRHFPNKIFEKLEAIVQSRPFKNAARGVTHTNWLFSIGCIAYVCTISIVLKKVRKKMNTTCMQIGIMIRQVSAF